jgi:hypothetical protein
VSARNPLGDANDLSADVMALANLEVGNGDGNVVVRRNQMQAGDVGHGSKTRFHGAETGVKGYHAAPALA